MQLPSRMYPQVMTCVYRLYNAAGQLLYVGVAYDFDVRFKTHAKRKAWWPEVAHRDIIWFDNRLDALYEEARAIDNEAPIHNDRRGVHPIGLMVINRYRPRQQSANYRDGELVVSSFDKTHMFRDMFKGEIHTLVAIEAEPAGVIVSTDWYLRAWEALGEHPPDRSTMPSIEAEELAG